MTRDLNIRDPEDLNHILSGEPRRASRVALKLEVLDELEQTKWERRINRYYRACGCQSAAIAALLTMVIGSGLAVAYSEAVIERPFVAAGGGFAALCAALGLGKAVGLWIARRRLIFTIDSLRERLSAIGSS